MAEWSQYPIPLGLGVATGLPQNPEQPRPLKARGLLPRAGRLFSFQEARVVPHQSWGLGLSDAETIAFDHFGLIARYSPHAAGSTYYLDTQTDSASNVTGVFKADEDAGVMAFWEQAGFTGSATQVGSGADLNHMLFDQLDDSMPLHGSTLSGDLDWSLAVAGASGGSLDEWVEGATDMRVSVLVVRTVSTPGGEFGVSIRQTSDTITFSSEKSVTVTVTQIDGYAANYLVYAQFSASDSGGVIERQTSDWLLCATMTSADAHVISVVPIGETLPGGSGGYLLTPYPLTMAIRHQNRYFAISGRTDAEHDILPGVQGYAAAPSNYVRSLGSVSALTPRRSVVYGSGLSVANMGTAFTHFTPQLHTSEYITALASSPAGLLIFGQNETLIARGNPDSTDFNVQVVSATIGCDEGVIPARLGGLVFVVHKGRVWAVNLGPGEEGITNVLTDISAGMTVPNMVVTSGQGNGTVPNLSLVSGGFVDIRADSRHNQLLGMRSYNISNDDGALVTEQVYRYDLSTGEWFDDPIAVNGGWDYLSAPSGHDAKWLVYPSADEYGVRYYPRFNIPPVDSNDENDYYPRYLVGRQGGTFTLEFHGIDCGKPHVTKQFRRVHLFAQGFAQLADSLMAADPISFLNNASRLLANDLCSLYVRVEQDERDETLSSYDWEQVLPLEFERGHWYFDLPAVMVGESIALRFSGQLFSETTGPVGVNAGHPRPAALNDGRLLTASYACLRSPIIVDYQDRRQLL